MGSNGIDNSLNNLVYNLHKLMLSSLPTSSYASLASELSVNLSTLRGWMSKNRTPTLKTVDKIADCLGCHAYQLLKPNGQTENIGIFANDSATAFLQNLQAIFNEEKRFGIIEKCALINRGHKDGEKYITETGLMSYFRTNGRRTPPLKIIDYIARSLNIKAYELLTPKKIQEGDL